MNGRRSVLAALLVLAGCGGGKEVEWGFGNTSVETPPERSAVVQVDDRVTVRFGPLCGQVEVDDTRTYCAEPPEAGTGEAGWFRADDLRIVHHVWRGNPDSDDPDAAAVDHAIVWSNRSPEGREVDAHASGQIQQVVWVMDDGEEPWGVQLIDDRGRLLFAYDLVGLPGD